MSKQRLELVFQLESIKPAEVLQILSSQLSKRCSEDYKVNFSDKVISLGEINTAFVKSQKVNFNLETEEIRIDVVSITNYKQILISIEEKLNQHINCNDWVYDFLNVKGFVQAWVCDIDYNYWQNAYDPIQYAASGRSYDSLPLKSNGLPFPLEQMVIDVSANVAKREIKVGYVEAIGCPMWLGELFWKYSVNSKEFLIEKLKDRISLLNNVVCISMVGRLFEDNSTLEEQKLLRKLLYGT
jgi:hypothetical protein